MLQTQAVSKSEMLHQHQTSNIQTPVKRILCETSLKKSSMHDSGSQQKNTSNQKRVNENNCLKHSALKSR